MLTRDNSIFPRIIKSIPDHQGAKVIYSMWEGYLTEKFKKYCEAEGLVVESVHASGHACFEDLKAFADALKPKMLVPIHTFHAQDYPNLFENVRILEDGEVLRLD